MDGTAQHAIPVTVVGGYLGAGKTTLINQLLRRSPQAGIAVVVNDFGAVNIDAQLIESFSENVLSLTNGCMCCSLDLEAPEALYSLLELDQPPSRIVIEASGVGDPAAIASLAALPGLRLDSIVVVVDAETVRARIGDAVVGAQILRQLRSADLVLLTKTDLVSAAVVDDVREWISEAFPRAAVILAGPRTAAARMLFGDNHHRPLGQLEQSSEDASSSHGDEYLSWSHRHGGATDETRLREVVEALPSGVLRGKGILAITSDPTQRYVFHLVGRRWSLARQGSWGATTPSTELAFIARAGTPDLAPLLSELASGA